MNKLSINTEYKKILLVDDDPVFLMMLAQFLNGHHYETANASCGIEALRLFQEFKPDAVLLDGDLPDLSGIDVCQMLKKLANGDTTPVIMVTAMNEEQFVDDAFQAGASDYITKPIHWAVLKNRLSYLLQVKEATTALQFSEARKSAILNATADAVITVTEQGDIIDLNPAAQQIFCLDEASPHMHISGLIPSVMTMIQNYKSESGITELKAIRYNAEHPQGERFTTELSCSQIWQHKTPLYTLTIRDISTREAHEEAMRLASSVFNNTSEAIIITDHENRIHSVNPAFSKITGYSEAEAIGHSPALLSSGRHGDDFYEQMWQTLKTEGSWQGEIWNRRKSGELYPEWLSINTVRNTETHEAVRYIGLFSDITQRKKYEEDIWYQAHYDALTDLPNRLLFSAKLQEAIAKQKQEALPFALLFIDLDRFKEVNDSLGHSFGDLLLLEAAQRLQQVFGRNNVVARLGGDEFTAILSGLHTVGEIESYAEKATRELRKPFILNGEELNFISGSIGITLCPNDAKDMETLLKHADMAMYRAKEAGRNTYRFYTDEMNQHAMHRIRLEEELRHAIKEQQFQLHYQPKLDLITQQIVCVEALIRWQHPEKGMVSPMDFIPLAEETGLINEIGFIVLELACQQLQTWRANDFSIKQIAVNVSSVQFEEPEAFFARFNQILAEHQLSKNDIKIEITENLLMKQNEQVINQLNQHRDHGLSVAIDDFGTGYSSLSYLQVFPLDELKIDQSFIRHLDDAPRNKTLVQAIIAMGHALNMKVIAEGVENQSQMDFLLANGCDVAQGYLLSRPASASELEVWLKKHTT
ncbi:PAS domain S-box-containing protein/diguanylate cyclase (GGDEF) domain-containing protein [Oceanospirillum multiglobuliferum]|uniref:cyclic-guanylate-specific phosphodiesterase n=1 Tax=Oceanospirillum multiglobuliferum TaxID=64969 RepID=A0A1T4P5X4_9GAMM|nr:EAL domain-containing protein [Oceanospirillum multiglobuliferum]OPX54847.1 hypothetical protein BTE48_12075 [Oceanospirillum multiglobuliferum]SJZ86737.1 PAS domain S-box-containing protein/diguanylate cyclase (GGDEF) domain-containing protein [Oceanospirillum multiglobuliferum]